MAKVKVIKKKKQHYTGGHDSCSIITRSSYMHSQCNSRLVYYYKFVPATCFSCGGEQIEWVAVAVEFAIRDEGTMKEILFPNDADMIVLCDFDKIDCKNHSITDYYSCEYVSNNGFYIHKNICSEYGLNTDFNVCGCFKRVKGKDDIQAISSVELDFILNSVNGNFNIACNKPVSNFIVSNSVSFKENPTFTRYLIEKRQRKNERL